MFVAAVYARNVIERLSAVPGGAGPVSSATVSACAGQDRVLSPVKNANEIYYHLDSRRVLLDRKTGYLYFLDAPDARVARTIGASLCGLNSPSSIEQMHLDPHRYCTGARRIMLCASDAQTVLVALRLVGVRATVR